MSTTAKIQSEKLGVGISLRRQHYQSIFETPRRVDWIEIISENFMCFGGRPREILNQAAKHWPIIPHGVGLSLGSVDPLNKTYLAQLKDLVNLVEAPWFSDHICFSSVEGVHYHDLLPVPKTYEALKNVSKKILTAQDHVGRPIAIENISYYYEAPENELTESEFISEVISKTGAHLLLDVNNVYVNSLNYNFDPKEEILKLPLESVVQIHLAGHQKQDQFTIDTHGEPVCDEVYDLYRFTLSKIGRPVATLIEWDNNVPALDHVLDHADRAREIMREVVYD